jgi:excisionase family DNA binding protein
MNASVVAGTVPANRDQTPMNTPLAYSIAQACEVANFGRTSIYEAINSGELIARKNGRRTVILSDDLRRWLQSLRVTNSRLLLMSQTADQLQGGSA